MGENNSIEIAYRLKYNTENWKNNIDEWLSLSTNLLWTSLPITTPCKLYIKLKAKHGETQPTKDLIVDSESSPVKIAETMEYINLNPLFNLSVNQVKIVYKQRQESPYIHKALKTGKIEEPPEEAEDVSPLTFHALTTGIHRQGISRKFMVAQHNFTQEIAEKLNLEIPEEKAGRTNPDRHASLAAIASSMLTATLIPPQVYRGALTTTIWRIRPHEAKKLKEESLNLLKTLHKGRGKPVRLQIEQEEKGRQAYHVKIGGEKCQINTLGDKAFGRIFKKLQKILSDLDETLVEGETVTLAIESTEQRGPIDLKAITSKLKTKQTHIKETIIIATPLTLTPTYITLKHSEINTPAKIILSSGTDRERITAAINYILNRIDRRQKLIYIYGGTTLHTAIAAVKLSKENRALLIPKT